jgi:hypothetical protein
MGLLHEKPAALAGSYPAGWTDANYAPNYNAGTNSFKDNYRSTSAYIFTCNGTAVTWRSRRQQVLATSSRDSETHAAAAAAKEAVHLRRLLAMPDEISPPVVLLGDNKSSIKAAENGTDKDRSKHIDVSAHFLRDASDVVMGLSVSSTCRARGMFRICSAKTSIPHHSTNFERWFYLLNRWWFCLLLTIRSLASSR